MGPYGPTPLPTVYRIKCGTVCFCFPCCNYVNKRDLNTKTQSIPNLVDFFACTIYWRHRSIGLLLKTYIPMHNHAICHILRFIKKLWKRWRPTPWKFSANNQIFTSITLLSKLNTINVLFRANAYIFPVNVTTKQTRYGQYISISMNILRKFNRKSVKVINQFDGLKEKWSGGQRHTIILPV